MREAKLLPNARMPYALCQKPRNCVRGQGPAGAVDDYAAMGRMLQPLPLTPESGLRVVVTSRGCGIVSNDVALLAIEGEGLTLRQMWESAYIPQGRREDAELAYYTYSNHSLILYNERKEEKLRLQCPIEHPLSTEE